MRIAYLGLGSNIGDREKNLVRALSLIKNRYDILAISSIFETSPVGYHDQPDFLNMVVKIDVKKKPAPDLLDELKAIEKKIGRIPTFHWGPRTIDIDILYIQGVTVESTSLTIPHRELLNREFVLIPLSELVDRLSFHGEMVDIKKCIQKITVNNGVQDHAVSASAVKNVVSLYKSKKEILDILKLTLSE